MRNCTKCKTANYAISKHADYPRFEQVSYSHVNNYNMFAEVDYWNEIKDGEYRGVRVDLTDRFAKNYPKQVTQLIDLGISVTDKQKQIDSIRDDIKTQKTYVGGKFTDHDTKLTSLGKSISDKQKILDTIGKDMTALGTSIADKQTQIDAIWGDIETQKTYVEGKFTDQGTKLTDLGTSVTDKQTQIDSIWEKIGMIPTGGDGGDAGGGGGCMWYDIPCHLKNVTSGIGTIALLAIGGLVIYKFVIKRGK